MSTSEPANKAAPRGEQPSYAETILQDPTLHMPKEWREILVKDLSRRKRQRYIYPVMRVLCITLIWITRFIKRLLPFRLHFERLMNFLSVWFFKRWISPEVQKIMYRHFTLENNLINFVVRNSGATDVPEVDLKPVSPEQFGDAGGVNTTILHDSNIMNLFIDLGKSKDADIHSQKALEDMDFSALEIPQFDIDPDESSRIFNFDFQTTLNILVFFMVLLIDDEMADNAANSLSLDESLLICIANLTGDNHFTRWSVHPYTNWVHFPFDPAVGLHKHIILTEFAHTRLCMMRDKRDTKA